MKPESLPTNGRVLLGEMVMLLRQIIGTRVEVASHIILNQRTDYVVLLVHLRYPSLALVIKFAGTNAPHDYPFERVMALHQLVMQQTTVPVAEVIAADSSCATWPWRFYVQLAMSGERWSVVRTKIDAADATDIYAQIGDAVGQIHAITFAEFGDLRASGRLLAGKPFCAALHERVLRTVQSARMQELALAVLARNAALFTAVQSASLCHEDLHGHNILLQHAQGVWKLSAVLDFDKAWAGSPEVDLARLEFWRGMTGEGFWPGYMSRYSIASGYAERKLLFQLLWCLEYAQPTRQHLADTNTLCRQLGLPQIDSFD